MCIIIFSAAYRVDAYTLERMSSLDQHDCMQYIHDDRRQHGGLMWDADSAPQLHTSNTPRSWLTGPDPAVTPARPGHSTLKHRPCGRDHSRSHARTYIVTRYYTRARSPMYWHIDYWTRAMQRRAFNQQQTVRTRYRRTDGRSYTHLPTATRHACPLQLI